MSTDPKPVCPACGAGSFEMRGERRVYATLTDELEVDGWSEADPDWIEWDTNKSAAEVIYCQGCDAEWTREVLLEVAKQ